MAEEKEGILTKFARTDEDFQRAEQEAEELILAALAQEKASHVSPPLFGSLAPWTPWEAQRCEYLERLVKFARARRISLREPDWIHAAMVHAAWEHPELQPPKQKRGRGAPRKIRGILATSPADDVDPEIKAKVIRADAINEIVKAQGGKLLSDARLAQMFADKYGGHAPSFANKLAKARKKLGREKRPRITK